MDPLSTLKWQAEAGADEAIAPAPVNRMRRKSAPVAAEKPAATKPTAGAAPTPAPAAALAEARALAERCTTLAELREAVENFGGCALKQTAMNTVFADGNPKAKVMVIGEAPGEKEDEAGIPFCGLSGQLLDKILGTIGLTRENFYITNTIFWRPPGNRNPSPEELAVCEPFVQRHIALVQPQLLICAGAVSATHILKSKLGISKLRGAFHSYQNPYMAKPCHVAVVFHPSYLLRSPGQKKLAWQDMLLIKQWLEEHSVAL